VRNVLARRSPKRTFGAIFLALCGALGACGARRPTPQATSAHPPPSIDAHPPPSIDARPTLSIDAGPPAEAAPTPPPVTTSVAGQGIVVQLAYKPTFIVGPPFSIAPPFTLLDDGTVIQVPSAKPSDTHAPAIRRTRLPPAEAARIVQHVMELGFARLESHPGECSEPKGGVQICADDDTYTILRVAPPGSELREVVTYSSFSNDPATLGAIADYLGHYRAPGIRSERYVPTRAILHVRSQERWPQLRAPNACHDVDLALLGAPRGDAWGDIVDGPRLTALLALFSSNVGQFLFCHGDRMYTLTLVPWIPGSDDRDELRGYADPSVKE
jgi:hypothetical protein